MSTVHALVFSALSSDTQLQTLGIDADSCWAAGSFEGPQPTPFMVMRWGNTVKGIGPSNSATLMVFVHDDPGSYERINAIIVRAREVIKALAASGDSGNWITAVEWLGDSGELNEEAYRTITRNAEFNVVANTL